MAILLNWCKDYSPLWHCGNCNLTAESPQISTRQPQTPDKAIGTLCCKCYTQEVLFLYFCVLFVPAVSVVSFHGQDRREPNMCVIHFDQYWFEGIIFISLGQIFKKYLKLIEYTR